MTHIMSYTTQTLTWSTAPKTEKPKLTENHEIISDILSVCDSLNRLCETLNRLEYVLKRKNIENFLIKENKK